jgi:hypothetical protein
VHDAVVLEVFAKVRAALPELSDRGRSRYQGFGWVDWWPDVPKGLETALRYDQIANCDLRTATTLATKQSFLLGAGREWRAGGRRCLGSCTAMRSALALFNIPHDKIMEIGIEFEI